MCPPKKRPISGLDVLGRWWIVILFFGALGGTVGREFARTLFREGSWPKANIETLNAPWVRQEMGHTGLAIQLPKDCRVEEKTLTLPEEARSKVESFNSYEVEIKGLYVGIGYVKYANGVLTNPEGAIAGALGNMAKSLRAKAKTVEVRRRHTEAVTVSGRQGLFSEGTIELNGKPEAALSIVVIAEGTTGWHVMVLHHIADDTGKEIAQRILSSIDWEDNQL
jgi:hypothetical protein